MKTFQPEIVDQRPFIGGTYYLTKGAAENGWAFNDIDASSEPLYASLAETSPNPPPLPLAVYLASQDERHQLLAERDDFLRSRAVATAPTLPVVAAIGNARQYRGMPLADMPNYATREMFEDTVNWAGHTVASALPSVHLRRNGARARRWRPVFWGGVLTMSAGGLAPLISETSPGAWAPAVIAGLGAVLLGRTMGERAYSQNYYVNAEHERRLGERVKRDLGMLLTVETSELDADTVAELLTIPESDEDGEPKNGK